MRMIVDYRTIWFSDPKKLEATVKEAIAAGWQPQGGLVNDQDNITGQAMVRYESHKEEIIREGRSS